MANSSVEAMQMICAINYQGDDADGKSAQA
jgi:hypothetical protein